MDETTIKELEYRAKVRFFVDAVVTVQAESEQAARNLIVNQKQEVMEEGWVSISVANIDFDYDS